MAVQTVITKFYPEARLLGHTFVDGTVAFYNSINNIITANAKDVVLLDLGCGRGSYMDELEERDASHIVNLRNFKGRVKKVIGLDFDKNAAVNPSIDEFHLLELDKPWPIEDESIDICMSDWVMEHVDDVDFFFSELNRVMKKDGYVCFRTVNKYGYIALVSSLIPNYFHSKLLKRIQSDRKEEDVFPTRYKCNTKGKISRTFKEHGFEPYVYHHVSEPSYFTFSYVSFAFGYYLHKLLPDRFKTTIFAFGKKI